MGVAWDSSLRNEEVRMAKVTKREVARFVQLADKMKFPIPREAFFAWLRNFYTNSVELAIFRTVRGKKEIFLNLRPPDDPYYANMWHMPGAIRLPGKTLGEMVRVCIRRELGGAIPETRIPKDFVKDWDNVNEVRGHLHQFLYHIELSKGGAKKVSGGQFFPLDKLPLPMVKSHVRMTNWLKKYFSK